MTQLNWITAEEQRRQQACERLQQITDERRNSFEARTYRQHRAAALKHTRSAQA